MKIKPIRMNKKSFSEYGRYLNPASIKQNDGEDYVYLRELALLDASKTSIGHLTAFKHDNVYTSLERHKDTHEMMVVLSGRGTILFAKPGDDPNNGLVALKVQVNDAFIMLPSTWHGLILPMDCHRVDMLVVFKQGTEDNDIVIKELTEYVEFELAYGD